MTLRRLPLFAWMIFVNAFLVILALPVLNAGLVMLLIDRLLDGRFLSSVRAAVPRSCGSTFSGRLDIRKFTSWPSRRFAILSEVIPVFSRKPIFGYEFVAGFDRRNRFFSLGVWAHHMFTIGLGHTVDLFFVASSMLIAIPTGVKVLNWSATMIGGASPLSIRRCSSASRRWCNFCSPA